MPKCTTASLKTNLPGAGQKIRESLNEGVVKVSKGWKKISARFGKQENVNIL